MSEFTKGPWKMTPCLHREGNLEISNDSKQRIFCIEQFVQAEDINLLLAAPDLYKACNALKEYMNGGLHPAGTFKTIMEQVDAAIAKADKEA